MNASEIECIAKFLRDEFRRFEEEIALLHKKQMECARLAVTVKELFNESADRLVTFGNEVLEQQSGLMEFYNQNSFATYPNFEIATVRRVTSEISAKKDEIMRVPCPVITSGSPENVIGYISSRIDAQFVKDLFLSGDGIEEFLKNKFADLILATTTVISDDDDDGIIVLDSSHISSESVSLPSNKLATAVAECTARTQQLREEMVNIASELSEVPALVIAEQKDSITQEDSDDCDSDIVEISTRTPGAYLQNAPINDPAELPSLQHCGTNQQLPTLSIAPTLTTSSQQQNEENYYTYDQPFVQDKPLPVLSNPSVETDGSHTFIRFHEVSRTNLTRGMKVYVKRPTKGNFFYPGILLDTQKNPQGIELFKVKCDFYKHSERDSRNTRFIVGSFLALNSPSDQSTYTVGCRVVGQYYDEGELYMPYAGIVAETPGKSNRGRYLIFFDDGYAQYVNPLHVFHVLSYDKSAVWMETSGTCRSFIKEYLAKYPTRLILKKPSIGQEILTEYRGKWWRTKVKEVDCSMVLLEFADSTEEWIYRGSPRLEPIIREQTKLRELENQEKRSMSVLFNKRNEESSVRPVQKARKQVRACRRLMPEGGGIFDRLSANSGYPSSDDDERIPAANSAKTLADLIPSKEPRVFNNPRLYRRHLCDEFCIQLPYVPDVGYMNFLLKPIAFGWQRIIASTNRSSHVMFRTPCYRMLYNKKQLGKFLRDTNCVDICVDHFSWDPVVEIYTNYLESQSMPRVFIPDFSQGKENVIIPVFNDIDNERPEALNYIATRQFSYEVAQKLSCDKEFMICCSCTDLCQDKTKCECCRLTIEQTQANRKKLVNRRAGYDNRRLEKQIPTGIYECNSQCKCQSSCYNRVVQNGMNVRLQLFKTKNKGWGIRCLDDIPSGNFLCVYAGDVYTDETANAVAQATGDEYFVNMDMLEVVDQRKETADSDNESHHSESEHSIQTYSLSDDSASSSNDDILYISSDEETNLRPNIFQKMNLNEEHSSEADTTIKQPTSAEETTTSQSDEEDIPVSTETLQSAKKRHPLSATVSANANIFSLVNSSQNESGVVKIKEELSSPPQIETQNRQITSTRRQLFNEDYCFVMDAKKTGNIGRFLNHSCSPNCFVQNVFVDTHDIRFPWIAFFAGKLIEAGEELTWDYNYEVDSVKGKVLWCNCGSSDCRGRLI